MSTWLASFAAILVEKLAVWGFGLLFDWIDGQIKNKKTEKKVDLAKETGDTSDLESDLRNL